MAKNKGKEKTIMENELQNFAKEFSEGDLKRLKKWAHDTATKYPTGTKLHKRYLEKERFFAEVLKTKASFNF